MTLSANLTDYTWHQSVDHKIQAYYQRDGLPHALLLWGVKGLGKLDYAYRLAQMILCQSVGNNICNDCQSCQWFKANTHPDFIIISAAENKKTIVIDDIRTLTSALDKSSVLNQGKVVLIYLAEDMNVKAANALLKILEEPIDTHFILISERPYYLPQTIKSRTQAIYFPLASSEELNQYLIENGFDPQHSFLLEGAPLRAETYLTDTFIDARDEAFTVFCELVGGAICPITASDRLKKHDIEMLYLQLHTIIHDLLMLKNHTDGHMFNIDKKKELASLLPNSSGAFLLTLMDRLMNLIQISNTNPAINKRLWLDDFLVFIAMEYL